MQSTESSQVQNNTRTKKFLVAVVSGTVYAMNNARKMIKMINNKSNFVVYQRNKQQSHNNANESCTTPNDKTSGMHNEHWVFSMQMLIPSTISLRSYCLMSMALKSPKISPMKSSMCKPIRCCLKANAENQHRDTSCYCCFSQTQIFT